MDFYRRYGFVTAGDEFVEAGIAHRYMTRGLGEEPLTQCAAWQSPAHGGGVLGLSEGQRVLDGHREHRLGLIDLFHQAQRSIEIFTHTPAPTLLAHPAVVDALRVFATLSPRTRIEAVFRDPQRSAREGARFLDLARQLPSAIEVRACAEQQRSHGDALVLVDGTGYVHQPDADRPSGTFAYRSSTRAAPHRDLLEEAWRHGAPHPDLRRLSL